jgi:lysophospholipase L1-like esterase
MNESTRVAAVGHRLPRTLRAALAGVLAAILVAGAFAPATGMPAPVSAAAGCRIYVAAGDDIPAGHDLNDNAKRYPEQLLSDHLKSPGWCVYNQGKNGQTSATFISGGGLSSAYNMRPDLLTIQLGEQNSPVVNLIKDCFDKIKDHDFSGGNSCAAQVLGNQSAFDNMRNNFTTILQSTRIMQSQRPQLVVAVVGYANPYPQASDVTSKITELCQKPKDSQIACGARWAQLPPALTTIDQAFQKLNQTLKDALAPFQQGPSGNRWVFVDIYPKFKSHEMKMDVTLRDDQVCHLCGTKGQYMDNHEGSKNVGTDKAWWIEGSDGTKLPDYLFTPGPLIDPPVVILKVSQTTKGMGVWVNADGMKCIDDAIWEADTIDPGTTPLKWKLGYGEASNTNICQ